MRLGTAVLVLSADQSKSLQLFEDEINADIVRRIASGEITVYKMLYGLFWRLEQDPRDNWMKWYCIIDPNQQPIKIDKKKP